MKVFIDNNGKFYKAKSPQDPSHAERPLVSADFLAVLPDDGTGLFMVDIDAAIKALQDGRS